MVHSLTMVVNVSFQYFVICHYLLKGDVGLSKLTLYIAKLSVLIGTEIFLNRYFSSASPTWTYRSLCQMLLFLYGLWRNPGFDKLRMSVFGNHIVVDLNRISQHHAMSHAAWCLVASLEPILKRRQWNPVVCTREEFNKYLCTSSAAWVQGLII